MLDSSGNVRYNSYAMQSSICTHSEYVTAKGTGGFTVRFLFLLFSKTFQKSVDKQRTRRYNVIEPKRYIGATAMDGTLR